MQEQNIGTLFHITFFLTCSEPHSVEHRLSFAVEVKTASANWKHPLIYIIAHGSTQSRKDSQGKLLLKAISH